MSHYFTQPTGPDRRRDIDAVIWEEDYTFTTSAGVFSGGRLDLGTSVLLRENEPPTEGRVLDLGCGFGPIAVAIARSSASVTVDAVDVNERALELTRINAERYGLSGRVRASLPEQVAADARYDEIWSNPPIRIGKEALHALLLHWLARLAPGGVARLVVGRNLGADSLQRWLQEQGYRCDRTASAKGFRVFEVAPLVIQPASD